MNKVNIIAIVLSILFLLFVINLVRKKRLQESYSLIWIILGIIFIIIASNFKLVDTLSGLVGIYYSPIFLGYVLIFFIILICIHFSISLSKRSTQTKNIIQETALLKNEIENLKKRINELTAQKNKEK